MRTGTMYAYRFDTRGESNQVVFFIYLLKWVLMLHNFHFVCSKNRDEVTANWENTRHTMTQEFKRKHKSAARNKARASKRFKSNTGPGPSDHP
jgi:hypothetical protein